LVQGVHDLPGFFRPVLNYLPSQSFPRDFRINRIAQQR
jgi:hypothetical protein